MFGAIEVRLVEDHSALHLITSLGPLLVAAAAIAAALIAWRSAGSRLDRQLSHDRQVRHDDHRRDAVDDALEIVTDITRAYADFRAELKWVEERRSDLGRDLNDPAKKAEVPDLTKELAIMNLNLRDKWAKAFQRLDELYAANTRLNLRFGIDAPIPKAAEKLRDKWRELKVAFEPALVENPKAKQKDELSQDRDDAADAYASLMTACSRWLRGLEI